jgi:hypothetical protein
VIAALYFFMSGTYAGNGRWGYMALWAVCGMLWLVYGWLYTRALTQAFERPDYPLQPGGKGDASCES